MFLVHRFTARRLPVKQHGDIIDSDIMVARGAFSSLTILVTTL
ncbi:hypothetical protein AAIG39_14935 [Phytobacter palmae]|uniref:Uncharacterized protein n=1 Tax=Phytobacter palmae TaxID=1855371 RepID=A0ABU9V6L1_9ENTR